MFPADAGMKCRTIESFDEESQRRILGGWSAWKRWKEGKGAEAIWNAQRPKYPIRRAIDVVGYNGAMKRLTKKSATKDEIEVINDWYDYHACQKIRACFYGYEADASYLRKAKILDGMFMKYDSFLDKNEPIYRGIRFNDKEEFKIFLGNAYRNLNKAVYIDEAPASFSRSKDVAYKEFAKADSSRFYSIVFKLAKRKGGELYIKEFNEKFSYQDEIVIKSHRSRFKIIDIREIEGYNETYEIVIEEVHDG